ncbi:MAG: D-alanyl-D-alanine dipeptidase [Algoriphagus sp.]|jgi:D-alanyl-D-alanine dipeptidase
MKIVLKFAIFLFQSFLLTSCATERSAENLEEVLEREIGETPLTAEEMSEPSTLEESLISQGLVALEGIIPRIRVELKYSTTDNFFGEDVYGDLERAFLQPEVAELLRNAQEKLTTKYTNLTLLIYDAARPLEVQQILWDNLAKPDSLKPLYVADPKVGSLHNFGVAVDLTIYDNESGQPLDMGTGYDFFGYAAYPDREMEMLASGTITKAQVANREILRSVMTTSGFTGIGSEWWHFNAFSRKEAGEKFELIN